MVFSDLFFLFAFLPAFFLCYLLGVAADKLICRRCGGGHPNRVKNMALVVFSLIFYAWGEPVYVFLMLASSVVNYVAGLFIAKSDGSKNKTALAAGVAVNLLLLATFKYLGWIVAMLCGLGVPLADPGIALPIGISFYTFQSISYLADVYRGQAPVQRRYADLLLYISMFPQLIAGPIVRYGTVAEEITHRRVTIDDFADGCYRFLIGLGKKVIIANQLSELSGQFLDGQLGGLSTAGAWIGLIAFTLQIYFDFSGYSDMAIGLGRCLGFHFNENFRHPYCCDSITDFWRRWHISLGSFFRDYVYIPLGGNRRHQPLNIFIVWFLTGLWHGASWNFVLWGLYFGIIVTAEKYTLLRVKDHVPALLLHVYSLSLVTLGWGIFYFDDFSRMTLFFQTLFGGAQTVVDFVAESALRDHFWLWVAAILLCMPVRSGVARLGERLPGKAHGAIVLAGRTALSLLLLCLSVALLVGATNNAFIYTRF